MRSCFFLIFSSLLLFGISCSTNGEELPYLDSDNMDYLLSYSNYVNSDKLIFIDSSNNEMSFDIVHRIDDLTSENESYWYNYKFERFKLISENLNLSFGISFHPFYRDNVADKRIEIHMASTLNNSLLIVLDSLGNSLEGLKEDKILLGKQFDEVIESLDINSANIAYSKLYFNKQEGVVGFKGSNGELWVFDRFE